MRRRFRRSTDEETAPSGSPGRDVDERDPADGPASGSFDALLARQLDRVEEVVDPVDTTVAVTDPAGSVEPSQWPPSQPSEALDGSSDGRPAGGFWDHYDRACAEAGLSIVPPAAIVAVVGPLAASLPVIQRCRDRHWMGDCDVFVLTPNPLDEVVGPAEPGWTVVGQPSELVAVLEEDRSDFPLLVLDVPCDLPAFVRPLVARLRDGGVGLVHYVLDGDPVDEDLATWHGELGTPSVLDLAGPVPADRVLELLERGDPVISVAGHDLTTAMTLALRIEQAVNERA